MKKKKKETEKEKGKKNHPTENQTKTPNVEVTFC